MRKPLAVLLMLFVVAGLLSAQQRRIYNDGQVDFAPGAARFVLSVPGMESNLARLHYSVNGGQVREYSGPVQLTQEGRNVITYRATDVTGNVSPEQVYTVVIDNTAPELSATVRGLSFVGANNRVFIRPDTALVLDAYDALSGVQAIEVSLDGRNFFRYTDAAFITEQGEHTGHAYAVDNVGNRSQTFSMTVTVDNTPPEVRIVPQTALTVVQGDRFSARGNQFRVEATDALSGVADIQVSINRQEFVTYTGPITVNSLGFQSIRARAVDNLGNQSGTVELTFTVRTETPRPTIQAVID